MRPVKVSSSAGDSSQQAIGSVGGPPAGTESAIDMNTLLNGRALRGVIQGDAVPQVFIPKLIEYYRAGRFPFDKLVQYYDFKDINQAFDDTSAGKVIKPILRISEIAQGGTGS